MDETSLAEAPVRRPARRTWLRMFLTGLTLTAAQANLFTALSWGGLLLISVIGIGWLLVVRRHADQEARAVLWRIPVSAGRG